MVINIKYCHHCGGVTQWEEVIPTASVTIGNQLIEVDQIRITFNKLESPTTGYRYCSCSSKNTGVVFDN